MDTSARRNGLLTKMIKYFQDSIFILFPPNNHKISLQELHPTASQCVLRYKEKVKAKNSQVQIMKKKITLKDMQMVKIALSFLHVMSKLLQFMILKLSGQFYIHLSKNFSK